MKKANPKAVWLAQVLQSNPRQKMIEKLPEGDLIEIAKKAYTHITK